MMSRIVVCSALLAALTAAPASALNNPIVVSLKPGSGKPSGSATIFQAGSKLLVNVTLGGGLSGAGVDIAEGSCAKVGATAVKLTATSSGRSTTEMDDAAAKFTSSPHVLVVRKTANDSSAVLACGSIKG